MDAWNHLRQSKFVSIFCRKSEDYSQKKLFCLTGEHMCFIGCHHFPVVSS